MTRKDFNSLASVLAKIAARDMIMAEEYRKLDDLTKSEITAWLQESNPRFDRARFWDAVYTEAEDIVAQNAE